MSKRLTVKQVAKLLDCHESTVRNYDKAGKLPAARDYRGYRIFNETEVHRLKIEREQLRKPDA